MPRYVPVHCEECARSSLSLPTEGCPICSFCEAPARVVPGPIFGDGDWLAFAEIERSVYDADLSAEVASHLAEELQQAIERQDEPIHIVQEMIKRVPALVKARPALVSALPRGLRLLMVQFIARTRPTPLPEIRLAN